MKDAVHCSALQYSTVQYTYGWRRWQYPHPLRQMLTRTACGLSTTCSFQFDEVSVTTFDEYKLLLLRLLLLLAEALRTNARSDDVTAIATQNKNWLVLLLVVVPPRPRAPPNNTLICVCVCVYLLLLSNA